MLMRNRAIIYVFKLADYCLLQTADYVGVASRACAQDLVAVFGSGYQGKIVFLPYPVPDQLFSYPLEITAPADIVLVFDGSISPVYEFSHLISAVEEMNNAGQHVFLVIYSSQQGRRMLRAQASARASFLSFRDLVPRHELIEALRQATAVVIPTSNHLERGVPIKAIEAMALGVPVIISNPRDAEVFRDGETCVVVPDNTPRGWREAIMRTIAPECREKIVREARAEAEKSRCSHNLEIISEILNRRGA
jgi:glycosyltransferase involved in cell wall biosynthesis